MTQIHNLVYQTLVYIGGILCENITINSINTTSRIPIGNLTCFTPPYETLRRSSETPSETEYESVRSRAKRIAETEEKQNLFGVKVKIGNFEKQIGKIEFQEKGFNMLYLYIGAGTIFSDAIYGPIP